MATRSRPPKNLINDRLKLINRARCYTYNPPEGCLFCGNRTFRYYSCAYGKKYYQCEKCRGIN